jgi:hypothetical protein
MERIPFGMTELDVDGSGYLPGGAESSDLSESLTDWTYGDPGELVDEGPEESRERIDASLFAAMLHP